MPFGSLKDISVADSALPCRAAIGTCAGATGAALIDRLKMPSTLLEPSLATILIR
ncbi:hypothetical protein D9M69_701350 [compost metagenome]